MNEKGFIKLHRKMLKWCWYGDTNTTRLFLHCILKANWKEGSFENKKILRGSFVTSRKKLANELELTEQQIKTAIKHLKSTNEITTETTNKFTIISIVNYDKYQDDNQVINHQITNKQPTTNQQLTTIEEYKNIRNKEESERERSSLAPTLSNIIVYGNSLGATSDYCEKFYNHYESIGWVNANGIKIKNWKLVLNNWYKKDLESGKIKIDNRRRLG